MNSNSHQEAENVNPINVGTSEDSIVPTTAPDWAESNVFMGSGEDQNALDHFQTPAAEIPHGFGHEPCASVFWDDVNAFLDSEEQNDSEMFPIPVAEGIAGLVHEQQEQPFQLSNEFKRASNPGVVPAGSVPLQSDTHPTPVARNSNPSPTGPNTSKPYIYKPTVPNQGGSANAGARGSSSAAPEKLKEFQQSSHAQPALRASETCRVRRANNPASQCLSGERYTFGIFGGRLESSSGGSVDEVQHEIPPTLHLGPSNKTQPLAGSSEPRTGRPSCPKRSRQGLARNLTKGRTSAAQRMHDSIRQSLLALRVRKESENYRIRPTGTCTTNRDNGERSVAENLGCSADENNTQQSGGAVEPTFGEDTSSCPQSLTNFCQPYVYRPTPPNRSGSTQAAARAGSSMVTQELASIQQSTHAQHALGTSDANRIRRARNPASNSGERYIFGGSHLGGRVESISGGNAQNNQGDGQGMVEDQDGNYDMMDLD